MKAIQHQYQAIYLLVGLGLLLVLHSLFYIDWIVDDAAISFVFSRNLANGLGWVPQAGRSPLESFSNPLWVLLLTPFYKLGLFDIYLTPKVLSWMLYTGGLAILYQLLTIKLKVSFLWLATLLGILVLSSPIIKWVNGGLENGLTAFLIICITYFYIQVLQSCQTKDALYLGILLALFSLTRPEGVIYMALIPLCLLIVQGKSFWSISIPATMGFSLIFGGYLIFRIIYFKELLPTPYGAKAIWDWEQTFSLRKLNILFRGMTGPLSVPTLLGMTSLVVIFAYKKAFTIPEIALIIIWSITILAFLLLPYDHLSTYRYATPFLISSWTVCLILINKADSWWSKQMPKTIKWGVSAALIMGTCVISAYLVRVHIKYPIVPFWHVAKRYGFEINEMGKNLGIEEGAILVPDAGGSLYYSRYEVHDYAGLIDRKIAQTFLRDHPAFMEYVFEDLKPVFIGVHGFWSLEADLYSDPRFKEMYKPIKVYRESIAEKEVESGIYVLKEVIEE